MPGVHAHVHSIADAPGRDRPGAVELPRAIARVITELDEVDVGDLQRRLVTQRAGRGNPHPPLNCGLGPGEPAGSPLGVAVAAELGLVVLNEVAPRCLLPVLEDEPGQRRAVPMRLTDQVPPHSQRDGDRIRRQRVGVALGRRDRQIHPIAARLIDIGKVSAVRIVRLADGVIPEQVPFENVTRAEQLVKDGRDRLARAVNQSRRHQTPTVTERTIGGRSRPARAEQPNVVQRNHA